MAFCPADCATFTLIDNPTAGCELKTRRRNVDKIGFFACSLDLPSPLTCENLEPLITNKSIVFSSSLANVEFQDPQFEELQIADCRPSERIITNRTVTFQDRIAVEIPAVAGPPAVAANPFYDYDFWKDKRTKRALLRYMFVFCDGTIVIPKDEFGKPMAASFDVFLSYERQGQGGNSYILEIKKGQLDFKGDPLDFNIPALDVSGCDFTI